MNLLHRAGYALLTAMMLFVMVPAQPAAAQSVATTGFYNNNSPYLVYSTGSPVHWTYSNSPSYSNARSGDVTRTTVEGAYVDFTFRGKSVTFWYSRNADSGRFKAYMDGLTIEEIATQNTTPGQIPHQLSRTYTVGNPNIPHTLRIQFFKKIWPSPATFLNADIDGFSVNEAINRLGDYDTNNPAIGYTGSWIFTNAPNGSGNNTITYSKTCGGLARYTYSGDTAYYEYSLGPIYGIAHIYIDGIYMSAIDMYNPNFVRRQVRGFLSPDLPKPQISQPLTNPLEGVRIDVHTLDIVISCLKNASSTDYYVDVDSIFTRDDTIEISYAAQTQTNWCWATVAQMVGQYTTNTRTMPDTANGPRQCELVSYIKGTPCPNQTGFIADISALLYYKYGATSSVWEWPTPASISNSSLRISIIGGEPVIIRWEWGGASGAHFVIIRGVSDTTGLYRVIVPRPTGSPLQTHMDLPYSNLQAGSIQGITSFTWVGSIKNIRRLSGS